MMLGETLTTPPERTCHKPSPLSWASAMRSSRLQLLAYYHDNSHPETKGTPHSLRTVLCQNLIQKYLSSTIITRKYSDLFSVAGLQSFHIAGLQPTKAKTQNKQNKNKVPLYNHKGNSGYLLK